VIRTRLERHRQLVSGSTWLLASIAVQGATGFAFWLVAARLASRSAVGQAAALFSFALFINYVTSMGLPVAVPRFALDDSPASHHLFGLAVRYTALSSLVGAAVCLYLVPGSVVSPLTEHGLPVTLGLLFLTVCGMSFALLVDARLMALRRWRWVLGRTLILGLARMPFLLMTGIAHDPLALFVLIAGFPALSGFVGVVALRRGGGSSGVRVPAVVVRAAFRYASVNYLSMLLAQAPLFALPFIVAVYVRPAVNANFYVAWTVALFAFVVPMVIGQALLAEGAKREVPLASQVRLCLALSLALMTAIAFVCWAGAGVIPLLYGAGYEQAARLLPLLTAAGIPAAVSQILLWEARAHDDEFTALAITSSFGLGVLVLAVPLTKTYGIDGATVAWIVGNLIAAMVAIPLAVRRRPGRVVVVLDSGLEGDAQVDLEAAQQLGAIELLEEVREVGG
jgi:O-antigen/teichoic acid export membrane protein